MKSASLKCVQCDARHEVAYQDLCRLVSKHASELSSLQLLAIAGNMVGKLIAMQDQRSITAEQALEIVFQNLQAGNRQILDQILHSQGSC